MIEIRNVIRRIVGSVRAKALVLPFHEAIGFGYVILLFIEAIGIIGIASIAVADNQSFEIVWKLTSQ
jgi:hypothetical protein